MDATLKKLTDFTHELACRDIPPDAVHECKRRILDTLACALGAFSSEPSKIARAVARGTGGERSARILFSLERSAPEHAAFANGVMIRYLDLNDATGSGGGHPSDALGALLAAAETTKTDGKTFILATVIVYELFLGFFAGMRIRNTGWDHVVYTVLAAAAAVAKMLKLDHARIANALSLALTPNMALEVSRRGQLTMWKGCAGGNACRNAIFAADLAAAGMTAPAQVFEGEQGVWNAVGKFEWPPLAPRERAFRVSDSQIKIYPCEYHGQSPIETALSIRSQLDPRRIESIVIRTYWFAWSEIGSEPEKWTPTTRETADHSMPFLVAAALLDGKVDPSSFTDARIADPELRALMQKVKVIHDTELDKLQPHTNACRMEITLQDGRKVHGSVDHPKGHVKNPVTDADLESKLVNLNNGLLTPQQVSHLAALCWRLDELDDVRELVTATRI